MDYEHIPMLKKRQFAMSLFHASVCINDIWFEQGVTVKLLAYLDDYINMQGTWAFITEYKDFLNLNTAWTRSFDPSGTGN